MWSRKSLVLLSILFPLLKSASAIQQCKAVPGTPSWPSISQWAALNHSVDGRLLQPSPPAAACHTDEPEYDAAACAIITQGWTSVDFQPTLPNGNSYDNWNNDSCIPDPSAPCSGEGYPVYVINATCSEDVKHGIDFARDNNVRLIVKGTGVDYLGRSSAPNSLSIWTLNMKGITMHESFKPRGCKFTLDYPAVTAAAGSNMGEVNLAANSKNLTLLSAGEESVGYGGYITGGGHGALANAYGLAADNVLEVEVVTPGGKILTLNECQNQDLFWAIRGGGGSTFGVITLITMRAFPSTPLNYIGFEIGTTPNSEPLWDALTYVFSQYPSLTSQGITGYIDFAPNTSINGTYFGGMQGLLFLPALSSTNTSTSLVAALDKIVTNITTTWPNTFIYNASIATFANFYDWWFPNNGPKSAGGSTMLGSRLLDETALTANPTALQAALKVFAHGAGLQILLVGGGKVNDFVPRGGSAVNPAWRKTIVHLINVVSWPDLNPAAQAEQENLQTNTYVAALRELAPNMGAYLNEADANEPNFQQAFWGDNYARLLEIKRTVDPDDVLWCKPCVGNERWEEVGDLLCKI